MCPHITQRHHSSLTAPILFALDRMLLRVAVDSPHLFPEESPEAAVLAARIKLMEGLAKGDVGVGECIEDPFS